ncbi:hypothetical protein [Streptomyces halobius]|uniref:Small integral membrane protein DUF2273 n=1 Tax=Streptomyces halobius TaxID=2879846 RepID=A0ABY4M8K7_9ACTN|nr:hypothetical protein [Streptomyces halobius]UQA93104.1 hypothetical protein K9S39_15755 [Streptomyces halobius]
MALTIPLVLLFGIVVALLIRFKALGIGAAVIAVLFGFYLADTGARRTINQLISSLAHAIGS